MEAHPEEVTRTNALLKALWAGEASEPKTSEVKQYLGLLYSGSSMRTITLANNQGITYIEWTTEELQAAMRTATLFQNVER